MYFNTQGEIITRIGKCLEKSFILGKIIVGLSNICHSILELSWFEIPTLKFTKISKLVLKKNNYTYII